MLIATSIQRERKRSTGPMRRKPLKWHTTGTPVRAAATTVARFELRPLARYTSAGRSRVKSRTSSCARGSTTEKTWTPRRSVRVIDDRALTGPASARGASTWIGVSGRSRPGFASASTSTGSYRRRSRYGSSSRMPVSEPPTTPPAEPSTKRIFRGAVASAGGASFRAGCIAEADCTSLARPGSNIDPGRDEQAVAGRNPHDEVEGVEGEAEIDVAP